MRHLKILCAACMAVLLLFVVRELLLTPLLPQLHDSNPHIARAIAYHTALVDGQFPPMWAKEVLGGIGSPVLMLNYQLPYLLGEIWHIAGLSFIDSYKLNLALSLVVSGVLMYLAISTKYGMVAGWVAAIVYTLTPYRMVDIFVRGALGESIMFVFAPMIILGLNTMSLPWLVVGWAGIFLTHPLAAACFSGFFLGYLWFTQTGAERKDKFLLSAKAYAIALMIAAFNLIPTLALTKKTYYQPALSDTLKMFPTLAQLIHSPWGYGVSLPGTGDGMSFEIGIGAIMALFAGIWSAKRHKTSRYILIMTASAILLMLPITTIVYEKLQLTAIIDFPWRLLFCVVFGTAWLVAEAITLIKRKRVKVAVAAGMTIGLITYILPMARLNKYSHEPESFFARETGDSYGEYAPRTRNTRESSPFWKRAEVTEGTATIKTQIEKSNRQQFEIEAQVPSVIQINTSYFSGWEVRLDGTVVECSVTKRTKAIIDDSGLFACHVPAKTHELQLAYRPPLSVMIGNLVSCLGIGIFLWTWYRSSSRHTTSVKQ